MQVLSACGLNVKDAINEILDLFAADYYKGPKQDFDYSGDIWEFKKNVDGKIFYVKLKNCLC